MSMEKVLQLSNISTELVLALGATNQVGKLQLIKKRMLQFRERRALDEEEAEQDLSHRYNWMRFELSWLSFQKLKPLAEKSQSALKRFCSSVVSAPN